MIILLFFQKAFIQSKNDRKGVREMNTKKIDEAINSICEWIDKECKNEKSAGDEIYKMVFALAAVMNARANMITHKND